jgi:hypothetical protein
MRLLLIALLFPCLGFCQLSVGNIVDLFNKKDSPGSVQEFLTSKGYHFFSLNTDTSGYKRADYRSSHTSILLSGNERVSTIEYKTTDRDEFKSWDSLIKTEGFSFEQKYFLHGKGYRKYTKGDNVALFTSTREDGHRVYYLTVL